jgi:hypothetical protein
MVNAIEMSRKMQRTVCLMLSAVMVAATLSLSVYGALSVPESVPYSVTVHY